MFRPIVKEPKFNQRIIPNETLHPIFGLDSSRYPARQPFSNRVFQKPQLMIPDKTPKMIAMEHSFPVRYSVLDASAIAEQLFPHYGLGHADSCLFWQQGFNDVYQLEADGARYYLRVAPWNWRSQAAVADELTAIHHLMDRGISTAEPLCTGDGAWVLSIPAPEGPRLAVLFRDTGGLPVRHPSVAQAGMLGRHVARMHAAWDQLEIRLKRFQLNSNYFLGEASQAIRHYWRDRPQDLAFFDALLERLNRAFSKADRSMTGLCHGDLHTSNCHFTESAPVFLDFDLCGYGPRVFDAAVFLWDLITGTHPQGEAVWQGFLEGYATVRPFTADELALVEPLIVMRLVHGLGNRLTQTYASDVSWLTHQFLDEQVRELQRWDEGFYRLCQPD